MYLAHKENEKKQELTVHLLEAGQYAQSEGEKIGIGTLATLCLNCMMQESLVLNFRHISSKKMIYPKGEQ